MKISVDLDVTLKNGLLILTDSKGKVLTFSSGRQEGIWPKEAYPYDTI